MIAPILGVLGFGLWRSSSMASSSSASAGSAASSIGRGSSCSPPRMSGSTSPARLHGRPGSKSFAGDCNATPKPGARPGPPTSHHAGSTIVQQKERHSQKSKPRHNSVVSTVCLRWARRAKFERHERPGFSHQIRRRRQCACGPPEEAGHSAADYQGHAASAWRSTCSIISALWSAVSKASRAPSEGIGR